MVKTIPVQNAEEGIEQLRRLRHENILAVSETFAFEQIFYILSERLQISLDDDVASPKYPKERELVCIVWQVQFVQREKSYPAANSHR
jgi:hypothetical protein